MVVDWDMNHQAPAGCQNPSAFRKVLAANPLVVKVLKYMRRENTRDRVIGHRDFDFGHEMKGDVGGANALARIEDHSLRDIKSVDNFKIFGKPAGDTSSPAANFDDRFRAHPITLPLAVEIGPVRFPKRIKRIVGPGFGAIFLGIRPRSDAVQRVFFAPLNPFLVRC